tara:strand:- start:274 stop:684 length:411 start_codon:yes stop_codon:yes gene_type:complete
LDTPVKCRSYWTTTSARVANVIYLPSKYTVRFSVLVVNFISESKVKCVKCGADTKVLGSRPHDGTLRRRRECKKCKHRVFTIEILEEPKVVNQPPPPVPKRKSFKPRVVKPRLTELDIDNMSDEELERAIYDGRIE